MSFFDEDTFASKALKVEETRQKRTMSFRWFQWTFVFLVFFCIAWDGFLLFWYGAALGIGFLGDDAEPVLIMMLFPLLHVAVGTGLTLRIEVFDHGAMNGFVGEKLAEYQISQVLPSNDPIL